MAIISAKAPCTPYQVVKSFANSPSLFYSSGEGSVYPAIKRLAKEGLITGKPVGTSGRPATGYNLSKKGRGLFADWYFDKSLMADGGFDPLRLRISALDSLGAKARVKTIGVMINALKNRLKDNEEMIKGLPRSATPYYAGLMEQAVLKAKLDLLTKWQKEGVTFREISGDFSLLEK